MIKKKPVMIAVCAQYEGCLTTEKGPDVTSPVFSDSMPGFSSVYPIVAFIPISLAVHAWRATPGSRREKMVGL